MSAISVQICPSTVSSEKPADYNRLDIVQSLYEPASCLFVPFAGVYYEAVKVSSRPKPAEKVSCVHGYVAFVLVVSVLTSRTQHEDKCKIMPSKLDLLFPISARMPF